MSAEAVAAPGSVVIFEPEPFGHQREWLEHLLRHLSQVEQPWRISLVVAAELEADLAAAVPCAVRHRVDLLALTESEQRWCAHRNLAVSAFARWWVMRRYLGRVGGRAGYFLALDHLSLPLALGLDLGGRPIGGILFRPSVHYRMFGRYRPDWRERLRDWRKALLYRLMLRNKALASVLSLDPYFSAYAGNHYAQGEKIRSLPDPANPGSAKYDGATPPNWVPAGRVGFLLFGVLTERKGILALLDALKIVQPIYAERMAVMLAGKVDKAIAAEVAMRITELGQYQPRLWLRLEDRRLATAEIGAMLHAADVALAPYQRFVGSSGVLLWAARSGRPLLTQDFGLVGWLTREHRLGLAVDTLHPSALAAALERMIKEGPECFVDRPAAERFLAERTPERFAAEIFASMAQS